MRASREAVARWNTAYAEQTTALFAASRSEVVDVVAIHRLAWAYREVAQAWRVLAGELAIPLWARHAATVAAEEFERRSAVEFARIDTPGKES
jgi:hypothetical protein